MLPSAIALSDSPLQFYAPVSCKHENAHYPFLSSTAGAQQNSNATTYCFPSPFPFHTSVAYSHIQLQSACALREVAVHHKAGHRGREGAAPLSAKRSIGATAGLLGREGLGTRHCRGGGGWIGEKQHDEEDAGKAAGNGAWG